MKIEPLAILLSKSFNLNKKFYFISGNEITLIEKISDKIIKSFRKQTNVSIKNIGSIDEYIDEVGLFEEKKVIIIKSCKGINDGVLNNLKVSEDIFIFIGVNSPKIKKIKNVFIKNKDSYLIDCYELDKDSKVKILNHYLESLGLSIEKNLYWLLIEKLDNKYAFFEDGLEKILSLSYEEITTNNVKKLLTISETGKEKVFFYLLRKNKEIIEVYREKIITSSDVNEFYYYCKFFCQLIIDSKDEGHYTKQIPVYLFREKNFLIDIYRRYGPQKKRVLLKLLLSTEKVLRKNVGLSKIFGLRFFLNIKKITVS